MNRSVGKFVKVVLILFVAGSRVMGYSDNAKSEFNSITNANVEPQVYLYADLLGADTIRYRECYGKDRCIENELSLTDCTVKINDNGMKSNHKCTWDEWGNVLLCLDAADIDKWLDQYEDDKSGELKSWTLSFMTGAQVKRLIQGKGKGPEQIAELDKIWRMLDSGKGNKRNQKALLKRPQNISNDELIAELNSSKNYADFYAAISQLRTRGANLGEGVNVDAVLTPETINSVIVDEGFFTTKEVAKYVGVVKVDPSKPANVIPLLNVEVDNDARIWFVSRAYDNKKSKWLYELHVMFERTMSGGFRKVRGVNYNKCQGVGLFVCLDPNRVDPNLWLVGEKHSKCPHWVASSKVGKWVPEIGYGKKSFFDDDLSEVEWKKDTNFCEGKIRTGASPDTWLICYTCSACSGTGYIVKKNEWRCPRCEGSGWLCDYKGYRWQNCRSCFGEGKYHSYYHVRCHRCDGKKYEWVNVTDEEDEVTLKEILEQYKY